MHCISGIVVQKSRVVELGLSAEENRQFELKLGYTFIPDIGPERCGTVPVVFVTTDYFGGPGDQAASYWDGGAEQYSGSTLDDERSHPINEALRRIGVVRTGDDDEFDTVGLGGIRSNEDVGAA